MRTKTTRYGSPDKLPCQMMNLSLPALLTRARASDKAERICSRKKEKTEVLLPQEGEGELPDSAEELMGTDYVERLQTVSQALELLGLEVRHFSS